MKKFVTAALAIFVTLVCMSKLTDKPDFAYPKQVADAATEELRGDISGAERLRLVGELVKARVEIEPDSMSVMPADTGRGAATWTFESRPRHDAHLRSRRRCRYL